jgi:predicted ATPase
MDTQPTLDLDVEDFGPIRSAHVELRPLTIFIGPNNSGKSYLAKLVYSCAEALFLDYWAHSRWLQDRWSYAEDMRRMRHKSPLRPWSEVPPEAQAVWIDKLNEFVAGADRRVVDSIRSYFSVDDLRLLVNRKHLSARMRVAINRRGNSLGRIAFEIDEANEFRDLQFALPDPSSISVPFNELYFQYFEVTRDIWSQILLQSGFPQGAAFYLPAGRSGLLSSAAVIAAAAMSLVGQRIGLEPIELGAFSGVEGDFVRDLNLGLGEGFRRPTPRGSVEDPLAPALSLIQDKIMQGEVTISDAKALRPVIVYKQGETVLSMSQSSSSIAELAPLALWIDGVLWPGDLLIIDEPESHLHPENQRIIARVLVRLANAGIRVICTTHSSIIVHQISNCMMASRVGTPSPSEVTLEQEDRIGFDQVAAYLFANGPDGTVVSPVEIDPDFGISEDEFLRVAEAIGEETYSLSVAKNEERLVGA